MNTTQIELFVAPRGCSHSSWLTDYYPDDLPEDWRLSFYSNEFRAIVMPSTDWINLDPVEIERWVEDTHEEFLFFIEVEDFSTDWDAFAELFQPLGEQLGGILLRPQSIDADLSMVASDLVSATTLAPVSLLLPDGVELSVAGKNLLDQYGVDLCWNVGEKGPHWTAPCASGLAVARVAGNMNFTARQWRETIETVIQHVVQKKGSQGRTNQRSTNQSSANLGSANPSSALLMLDTDHPKTEDLRSAMIIADMLVLPMSV